MALATSLAMVAKRQSVDMVLSIDQKVVGNSMRDLLLVLIIGNSITGNLLLI